MLVGAIVGHLVGDYLLQNDWMALNKKSSSFHCAVHCLVWSVSVVIYGMWPLWTLVPLFLTHYVQDRTNIVAAYMDSVGQKQFRTGACAPWSSIVVDNVFHVLVLWLIAACLGEFSV